MKPRLYPTLCLLLALLTACPPAPQTTIVNPPPTAPLPRPPRVDVVYVDRDSTAQARPRNVILMIGDGMGVTQISAGLYANGNRLNLERFPFIGLHKSYSGDNLVTDSAAGATAFSAGVKTYNGAIGVGMDTLPVKTILEYAEERGMPTGLVATSSIVHATPASFAAHNRYRKNYEDIASDMARSGTDLMIGGGLNYFGNRKNDRRDLVAELRANGYVVDNFIDKEIAALTPSTDRPLVYLTANAEPLPRSQGRDYLPAATELALDFLDGRDTKDAGFFLMIEGSQIDWGGHSNESEYIIDEMLEFDGAVGEVLDFAKRDGETLVIVTADHETGGYAIQYGSRPDSIVGAFTSDYHTADLIPVFAYGPGAARFSGVYENTAIFDKMMLLLGLGR